MPDRRPKVNIEAVRSRVEKKIKRASEYDANLNFLIYGNPKVGKTRLASTAPEVLLVDVDEEGTDSVRADYDPRCIRIKTWTEINDIYWYLQAGDHPFESVAIDGLTGLQTLCMNFVLGDEASRDASRDPDSPTPRIYQKVSQLMKIQITNFRNLPMNTIFTALSRTRDVGELDDDSPHQITGPSVSPAIQSHVTAAVGTIGYVIKREVTVKARNSNKTRKVTRTRLVLDGMDGFILGERSNLFGNYVDGPNLTDMLETIKNGKRKET